MAEEETNVDETTEEETQGDISEEEEAAGDDDTADEDTGEEEEAATEEETEDEFGEDLLEQASAFGYDEDGARAFGKADNLRTALAGLDGKVADMGRKMLEGETKDEDEDEEEPVRKPAKPARSKRPAESREASGGEDAFEVDLGEDVEPEIAKAIKAMNDHYRGRLEGTRTEMAELKKNSADLIDYVRVQESRAFRTRMDGMFAGLDDEWESVFGKKPVHELGQKSAEFKNRLKVLDTLDAIAKGLEATGQEVPDEGALLKRAIAVDFGKQQKAMTRKALMKAAKKRGGQITSRPTQRKASEKTGMTAAVARQKDFDKKLDAADED